MSIENRLNIGTFLALVPHEHRSRLNEGTFLALVPMSIENRLNEGTFLALVPHEYRESAQYRHFFGLGAP